VIAEEVMALEDPALLDWRASSVIHVRAYQGGEDGLRLLSQVLKAHPGDSRVVLHLRDNDGDHELELDSEYSSAAEPELEAAVLSIYGEGAYRADAVRALAPPPRYRGPSR